MAIGRNISAVVKVVQDPELQGQLVFVGSNARSVHSQRGIAVARSQVAEDLVVGAVFFQNVDDVPDWIPSAGKRNLLRINVNKVIFFNLACVDGQVSVNLFPAEPLNRPSDQRRNIRMRIKAMAKKWYMRGRLPSPKLGLRFGGPEH